MSRPLVSTLASALVSATLLAAPALADVPPIACPPDDGRDILTTDGFQLDFEAPAPLAPELAATRGVTGDVLTRQRSAHFYFRADFTPYESGDLQLDLTWTNSSDYDLYVFDGEGQELGRSDASNIDGGDTKFEGLELPEISHCADLSVEVRNWAGRLDEMLRLKISFKNPGPILACALDDAAPGCAGVEEGGSPVRIPDARTRLYAGGDPGQLSMIRETAGGATPFEARLETARPITGKSNQYTRPVVGFRDQYQNPFIPHFTRAFAEPIDVVGEATGLVWVSSPTLSQGGVLFVDLYVDGTLAKSVEIPGAQVPDIASPLVVRFPNLDFPEASSVALQVGTQPAISSGGPGNPADALFTIYYGSVQFQSRITLPPAPASAA